MTVIDGYIELNDGQLVPIQILKTYYCHNAPVKYIVQDESGNIYETAEILPDLSAYYGFVPQ